MKKIIIRALFGLIVNFSVAQTIAVQQSAEFNGGLPKFYKYLDKNIKPSEAARKKWFSGIVNIKFLVKKNGELDIDSIRVVPKDEMIKLMGV